MAPETGVGRLRPGGSEGGRPPAQRQLLRHEVCSASKTFLNTETCTRAKTTWMQPVSSQDTELLSLDASYHCKGRELRLVGLHTAHGASVCATQQLPLKHLWLTTNSLASSPTGSTHSKHKYSQPSKAISAEMQKKEKGVDTSKFE